MHALLTNSLRFIEAYAARLTADLTPEQMTYSAGPGHENHPAFTLGHLVTAADMAAQDLGLPSDLPPGYADLFLRRGPSDRRLPAPANGQQSYQSRVALLAELNRQHNRIIARLGSVSNEQLQAPVEQWKLAAYFPTLLETLVFMTTTHAATHLGQLAAWRRAMGLPAAMAEM